MHPVRTITRDHGNLAYAAKDKEMARWIPGDGDINTQIGF